MSPDLVFSSFAARFAVLCVAKCCRLRHFARHLFRPCNVFAHHLLRPVVPHFLPDISRFSFFFFSYRLFPFALYCSGLGLFFLFAPSIFPSSLFRRILLSAVSMLRSTARKEARQLTFFDEAQSSDSKLLEEASSLSDRLYHGTQFATPPLRRSLASSCPLQAHSSFTYLPFLPHWDASNVCSRHLFSLSAHCFSKAISYIRNLYAFTNV